MMGLLTTISLVGSLVLWAGYQAFYVPSNRTQPLVGQNFYNGPYNSRRIPQKFLRKPDVYNQGDGTSRIIDIVNSLSKAVSKSYKSTTGLELSSSLNMQHTGSPTNFDVGYGLISVFPKREESVIQKFESVNSRTINKEEMVTHYISEPSGYHNELNTDKNKEQGIYSSVTSSSNVFKNSLPIPGNPATRITEANSIDNNTETHSFGGDLLHKLKTIQQLVSAEDNHFLNPDLNLSDHHLYEKLDHETLSSPTTAKLIGNNSVYTTSRPPMHNGINSLNVLYTLVTFVKNIESQEMGNFSKTLDNLIHVNISKVQSGTTNPVPVQEQVAKNQANYGKGTAHFLVQENVATSQASTQDIVPKNLNNNHDSIARYQDIPLNENTESTKSTKGLSLIEELRLPNHVEGINPGKDSPSERLASEKAKMLSTEYMKNFGWQGYLLIFFIIIIVLLLLTTLTLFTTSYFTWRRNKRKLVKNIKASNSYKEA